MKTFNFLTTRQHEVLAALIAGQPLGPRTSAQTTVLRNLKRLEIVRGWGDDLTVNEVWRARWEKWQKEQGA